MNKHRIFSIIGWLFSIFPVVAIAQIDHKEGVGEISEIIIPASSKIQNNFNLFYEVHLSRQVIQNPSFWYKIVFSKACSFEFTLIPLIEDDRYDFFFYKISSNMDFCTAIKEEKIVSCNTERIHKTYNDREQSEKFRSNLVDVKSIPVKAGDAIYIEVFSVNGHDCGHVLDFRTSSTSFVVKVVNDNCSGNANMNTPAIETYKPATLDEKNALGIFGNILCPPDAEPMFISSIKVADENVTIQKKLDFAKYSKSEAQKKDKKMVVSKEVQNKNIVSKTIIPIDSVIKSPADIKQTEITQPEIKKTNTIVKSTADLNSLEENTAQIKHEIICVKTNKDRNSTRLEVDYVLFSLLHEDLKRKTESIAEQLSAYSDELRKTKEREKRQEISASIKETKELKTEIQTKIKDTDNKLKRISKLLREERKKKSGKEESIFAKCEDPEGAIKQDFVSIVKQDSSAKAVLVLKGVIYKVQIGVYKTAVSPEIFKGLTPVFEESFAGGVKYTAGAFTHFSDAKQAKDYIKNMGLTDAFVIAYYKGNRVSIEDARSHENDK